MRLFKKIDVYLQVALFLATLVLICIELPNFIYFYFLVGGAQVASILVHLACPRSFYASTRRRYYLNALLVLIAIGFLMLIPPLIIVYFGLLMFVTPAFAIWYFLICRHENGLMEKKALIHLK